MKYWNSIDRCILIASFTQIRCWHVPRNPCERGTSPNFFFCVIVWNFPTGKKFLWKRSRMRAEGTFDHCTFITWLMWYAFPVGVAEILQYDSSSSYENEESLADRQCSTRTSIRDVTTLKSHMKIFYTEGAGGDNCLVQDALISVINYLYGWFLFNMMLWCRLTVYKGSVKFSVTLFIK